MNRQIKFRDFCFDTNKMRYFDLDHYDKNEHDCFGNIMQFTGMVDDVKKTTLLIKEETSVPTSSIVPVIEPVI